MADNKRYYWLKLDEGFFEDDTIAWLEEQENGKDYVIFYLKLALKSLQDEGILIRYVGETLIPYDVKALAKLTNTPIDTVAIAIKIFVEIGLIARLDTGEIYLNQINEMIGTETDVAKRVRKHRAKKRAIGQQETNLLQCNTGVTKCNTEIEIEKELEIDIELEKDKELEKEKKKPKSKKPIIYDPDEKLNQAILDFIDFRKKIRATMTDRAITLMLSKLNKMTNNNDEKIEILEQSIMNGWKSVYPLKNDKKQGKQSFDDFVEVGKEWLSDTAGVFDDSSND